MDSVSHIVICAGIGETLLGKNRALGNAFRCNCEKCAWFWFVLGYLVKLRIDDFIKTSDIPKIWVLVLYLSGVV